NPDGTGHDRNTGVGGWQTQTRTVNGTNISVRYDSTSPQSIRDTLTERVERAITLVQAAGYAVPDFQLFLPKYARSLHVDILIAPETDGRTLDIIEHPIPNLDSIAQFFAPGAIIVSPQLATAEDPARSPGPNPMYAVDEMFDESSVATIVHELGHFLNRQQSP